jgi:hypothetical protein
MQATTSDVRAQRRAPLTTTAEAPATCPCGDTLHEYEGEVYRPSCWAYAVPDQPTIPAAPVRLPLPVVFSGYPEVLDATADPARRCVTLDCGGETIEVAAVELLRLLLAALGALPGTTP